jgi:serine-aspartate repeat-containing protein C/D/E
LDTTNTDINNVSNIRNYSQNNSRASSIETEPSKSVNNKEQMEEEEEEKNDCTNSDMLTDDLDSTDLDQDSDLEQESDDHDEEEDGIVNDHDDNDTDSSDSDSSTESESDSESELELDESEGRVLRRSSSNVVKKLASPTKNTLSNNKNGKAVKNVKKLKIKLKKRKRSFFLKKRHGTDNRNGSSLKKENILLSQSVTMTPTGATRKKKKLSTNGASADANGSTRNRLCSMPGYNMLSENEKKLVLSVHMKPNDYINYKTILIKNNLAYRQQNQQTDSFNLPATNDHSALSTESNGTNTTTSTTNAAAASTTSSIMLLRRHNSNIDDNSYGRHNVSINTLNENSPSPLQFNFNKNKLMMSLMKISCPNYFEIPRSTRKRILRFLCDNGWIDVS